MGNFTYRFIRTIDELSAKVTSGSLRKSHNPKYLEHHPEFTPMPAEPFERELEAARRTKTLISKVYGI